MDHGGVLCASVVRILWIIYLSCIHLLNFLLGFISSMSRFSTNSICQQIQFFFLGLLWINFHCGTKLNQMDCRGYLLLKMLQLFLLLFFLSLFLFYLFYSPLPLLSGLSIGFLCRQTIYWCIMCLFNGYSSKNMDQWMDVRWISDKW